MTAHTSEKTNEIIQAPAAPTFREGVKLWAKIGLLSFGGPAGQIALMHRELVEERRWIGEQRFLHAAARP
jgi:chromate transporter